MRHYLFISFHIPKEENVNKLSSVSRPTFYGRTLYWKFMHYVTTDMRLGGFTFSRRDLQFCQEENVKKPSLVSGGTPYWGSQLRCKYNLYVHILIVFYPEEDFYILSFQQLHFFVSFCLSEERHFQGKMYIGNSKA